MVLQLWRKYFFNSRLESGINGQNWLKQHAGDAALEGKKNAENLFWIYQESYFLKHKCM